MLFDVKKRYCKQNSNTASYMQLLHCNVTRWSGMCFQWPWPFKNGIFGNTCCQNISQLNYRCFRIASKQLLCNLMVWCRVRSHLHLHYQWPWPKNNTDTRQWRYLLFINWKGLKRASLSLNGISVHSQCSGDHCLQLVFPQTLTKEFIFTCTSINHFIQSMYCCYKWYSILNCKSWRIQVELIKNLKIKYWDFSVEF